MVCFNSISSSLLFLSSFPLLFSNQKIQNKYKTVQDPEFLCTSHLYVVISFYIILISLFKTFIYLKLFVFLITAYTHSLSPTPMYIYKHIVTQLEVSFSLNLSSLCYCILFLITALNCLLGTMNTKVVTLAAASLLLPHSDF